MKPVSFLEKAGKNLLLISRKVGPPAVLAVTLVTVMLTFQNCGDGFSVHEGGHPVASQFPSQYTPYGNLPSQTLTTFPGASRATVNAGKPTQGGSSGVYVKGY